jgi:hypothetical protein
MNRRLQHIRPRQTGRCLRTVIQNRAGLCIRTIYSNAGGAGAINTLFDTGRATALTFFTAN